ncbi:UNC-50 family-domain-containing protein [Scheffersomyces amazonensis]|uniref:UNC-50 family-domain-containing protein n=1 Tax=Scheffersomyces amazonensis TaxID=1078765 RepID=UPI00315C9AF2
MSKRVNLPYSTQDLFPHVASTPNSSRFVGSTTAGSIISTHSSLYTPRTNNYNSSSSISSSHTISSRFQNLKKMIRRLFKPTTLDFETAIWEIFHLVINPKKMYRSHYFYKQQTTNNGKSSYTRDDPSFLILLTIFLSISAIAWGLAYSPRFLDILKLIVYMVFIDFYLTGFIIATISWFITNKLFNNTYGNLGGFNKYNVNYIEWGFCFDIHCNSFLVIWALLYLLQFLLLPLLRLKKSLFSLILGNSLYFGSIGYYFVSTFYGFNSLPFINASTTSRSSTSSSSFTSYSPAKLLQLIIIGGILPILAIAWIISIGFGFNVADAMVDTYFN